MNSWFYQLTGAIGVSTAIASDLRSLLNQLSNSKSTTERDVRDSHETHGDRNFARTHS